jgi:pyruvate formate lyase activating enzyme
MKVEARYYDNVEGHIQCRLCPHVCAILPGKLGLCRARLNEDGKLWAINYGDTTSVALDPIEKKPLYHFHPGSQILSIACNSCNMRCPFCQNWEISQKDSPTQFLPPDVLGQVYQDHKSIGVSYTYTEPLVWYEYILDAATRIRELGGKNVLVTNGLINEEPLRELLPLIDAMNIDLKTMDAKKYQKVLSGNLDTVKKTIETAHAGGHVEVTNLIVTGFNDKEAEVDRLIDYVASVGPDIPLHFSRYYPNYNYKKPPTPAPILEYAYEQGRKKLHFVYLGNVPIEEAANTYCPKCGSLLIERMYFRAIVKGLRDRKCAKCGADIAIII